MQLFFTRFTLDRSTWPDHATVRSLLLGAGATLYLALVCAMLYTIVVLIHGDEQPPPFTRPAAAQPVVLTLPVLQLNADSCLQLSPADRLECSAQARLEAMRRQVSRRIALRIHSMRTATGNLLWAPPGAVLVATDSLNGLPSGEKLLETALTQAHAWNDPEASGSSTAGLPTMVASR